MALQALLGEDEIPTYLTDDESLVDLLEGSEINRILKKKVAEMEPED